MNETDIDNMEVLREVDALVGSEIFGYKVHRVTTWAGIAYRYEHYYPNRMELEHVPEYSADIAEALKVVEKMEEGEWQFRASNTIPNSDPIIYEWEFTNAGKRGDALEFSMPMAICKAALKAVLAGEEGERNNGMDKENTG